MKYGSDEFNKWIVEAKKYQSYCELAHGDPDTLAFAKALLAAQSEIDRLTKIKTPPGVPYDPEYSKTIITLDEQNADLQKKITALESCIIKKDEALYYYGYKIVPDSLNNGSTEITTDTGKIARKALALTPESVKRVAEAKKKVIDAAKGFMIHGIAKDGTHGTLLKAILAELEALQRGEK